MQLSTSYSSSFTYLLPIFYLYSLNSKDDLCFTLLWELFYVLILEKREPNSCLEYSLHDFAIASATEIGSRAIPNDHLTACVPISCHSDLVTVKPHVGYSSLQKGLSNQVLRENHSATCADGLLFDVTLIALVEGMVPVCALCWLHPWLIHLLCSLC